MQRCHLMAAYSVDQIISAVDARAGPVGRAIQINRICQSLRAVNLIKHRIIVIYLDYGRCRTRVLCQGEKRCASSLCADFIRRSHNKIRRAVDI